MTKYIVVFCLSVIQLFTHAADNSFTVFSDRDIYVSGEEIAFKAFLSDQAKVKVIYIDLCTYSGRSIAGEKLEVINQQADGYLQIPDSVKTNTYLLRSYIQLQNKKEFFIKELLVANRFDKEEDLKNIEVSRLKNESRNSNCIELPIELENNLSKRAEKKFTIDKELLGNKVEDPYFVCISKCCEGFNSSSKYYSNISEGQFFPLEEKGSLITGTVLNKSDNKPVDDATVYLSVPDSIPGFKYYLTKEDGRFYFLMDAVYGNLPVVIQAVKTNFEDNLKLQLDSKFDNDIIGVEVKQEKLNDLLSSVLKEEIDRFTYQKVFHKEKLDSAKVLSSLNKSFFYGNPEYVVDPDLFFDLPDFTEISRELLLGVKFRNKNDQLSLQLIDTELNNYYSETPMLLLDGIPIHDLNIIKKLGTNKIDWIHTVLATRFYGNLKFMGVVAIYSGKYDLKWLKESDWLIKLNYHALQNKKFEVEDISQDAHIPDLRARILWNPEVDLGTNQQLDFITSDVKGTYRLQVAAKLSSGEIKRFEKVFTVN